MFSVSEFSVISWELRSIQNTELAEFLVVGVVSTVGFFLFFPLLLSGYLILFHGGLIQALLLPGVSTSITTFGGSGKSRRISPTSCCKRPTGPLCLKSAIALIFSQGDLP